MNAGRQAVLLPMVAFVLAPFGHAGATQGAVSVGFDSRLTFSGHSCTRT